MQNYKESLGYRFFVVKAGTLVDPTKSTADLAATQVGLFNAKKGWKALPVGTSASAVPEVVIAYGSPNTELIPWTNAGESIKTTPIKAKNVVSLRKSVPKKPKNHVVAIGYDGIDPTKTITTYCDETYTLLVQVEGSPASRFFGGKPFSELFVYETGCCPDNCEPVDPCDKPKTNAEDAVDYFVSAINNHVWMKNFVKAEKQVIYTAAPVLDTEEFIKYQITIPDDGTAEPLGKLQATYGIDLKRVDRVGIYSTYELILSDSANAPGVYTLAGPTILPICDECPVGYEYVSEQTIYKVIIPNAAPIAGDISDLLDANEGILSTISWGVDEDGTITVVVIGSNIDFGDTLVIPGEEGEDGTPIYHTVEVIGVQAAKCVLEDEATPCEYPWIEIGEYVKVKRDIKLTIGVDECGGVPSVEDLEEYFAGFNLTDFAIEEDEDCGIIFTAKQLSSNLIPVKDCGTVPAEFDRPEPYKGFLWEVIEEVKDPANIEAIGIKLTGSYINTEFGTCAWHYDDLIELDIPKIIVRQGNDLDQLGKCKHAWPVTILQLPSYPSGIGANVQKDYIEQSMFLNQCFTDDRRWREIHGYDYDFINRKKYYVIYYLTYEAEDKYDKYTNQSSDQRTTITFAVEEDDFAGQTAIENLLGSWVNSVKPDLIDGDWLFNAYRK